MLLMCKNVPVYDIDNEKILNRSLLPGLMQQKGSNNHTFTKWMKYRYSSGTNTMARKLKGITFGQGARMRINRETRALSFCDCYWLKAEDDPIRFEEISLYYKPFWNGSEAFAGQAAPTLYVGGALSKEWKQDGVAIINQIQVPEYADAAWKHEAKEDEVMVLHTLVVDPFEKKKGHHEINTFARLCCSFKKFFFV